MRTRRKDSKANKTALMLVHALYVSDPRVRRASEALVTSGWNVDVVCMRDQGEPATENIRGVNVYRLPIRRRRGASSLVYIAEYLAFFFLACIFASVHGVKKRYRLVHVNNPPDFLIFAPAVPRLLGAKSILDFHELWPEFFSSKLGVNLAHPVARLLLLIESISVWFADAVITAAEAFKVRLMERGVPEEKITVVLNSADPRIAQVTNNGHEKDAEFSMVYHGTLSDLYRIDLVVRSLAVIREAIPGVKLNLYGRGPNVERVLALAEELGLSQHVEFGGYIEPLHVASVLKKADAAVVPLKRDIYTDLAFPSKVFEYILLGIPVIASSCSGTRDVFGDDCLWYFKDDDVEDLIARVMDVYSNPYLALDRTKRAKQVYESLCWDVMKQRYVLLVESLTA